MFLFLCCDYCACATRVRAGSRQVESGTHLRTLISMTGTRYGRNRTGNHVQNYGWNGTDDRSVAGIANARQQVSTAGTVRRICSEHFMMVSNMSQMTCSADSRLQRRSCSNRSFQQLAGVAGMRCRAEPLQGAAVLGAQAKSSEPNPYGKYSHGKGEVLGITHCRLY